MINTLPIRNHTDSPDTRSEEVSSALSPRVYLMLAGMGLPTAYIPRDYSSKSEKRSVDNV